MTWRHTPRGRAVAELHSEREDFGDTRIDRAKTLGLIGEIRPIFAGECLRCSNLPHRRHPDGCFGCGKPFVAEKLERTEASGCSSIALAEIYGNC